jgi:hypothetical protein
VITAQDSLTPCTVASTKLQQCTPHSGATMSSTYDWRSHGRLTASHWGAAAIAIRHDAAQVDTPQRRRLHDTMGGLGAPSDCPQAP